MHRYLMQFNAQKLYPVSVILNKKQFLFAYIQYTVLYNFIFPQFLPKMTRRIR